MMIKHPAVYVSFLFSKVVNEVNNYVNVLIQSLRLGYVFKPGPLNLTKLAVNLHQPQCFQLLERKTEKGRVWFGQ